MEFTGKITGIVTDKITGTTKITFSVNEPDRLIEQYNDIAACDRLTVKATKYRNRRSLNANSYFHLLNGKLAAKLNISNTRCKNELIHRYGVVDEGYAGPIELYVSEEVMLEQDRIHVYPIGVDYVTLFDDNGSPVCDESGNIKTREITLYQVYKPTHLYDTAEMAVLIDGVVDDCRDMGIDTYPPEELERLKSMWNGAG